MRISSLSSCCCQEPLPCRLSVACHPPVRWGQGSGAGHLGLSAPMPRNLESGCAWAVGVFSACCWLWGEAQTEDGL